MKEKNRVGYRQKGFERIKALFPKKDSPKSVKTQKNGDLRTK